MDILRDPVKAIMSAKKRKNMGKSWISLAEASILLALAAALAGVRTAGLGSFSTQIAVIAAVSVFVVVFVSSIILGYILKIIVTTLGGSGRYYEGLTAIAYSLLPISVALFLASLFALVPQGIVLSAVSTAIGFAYGLSMLYRSIKELFKTDMLTAFVAVSILIVAMFVAASVSMGFAALTRIGSFVPL